jgi:NIMA-interacting peptidyl-prolyl cis-trans isomerase 1
MEEITNYMQKIQSEGAASFPNYAKERSDCSSFRADGDLGFFGRGMMQQSFEDAAFALEVGEISGIVSSDSGYHLIYRIA